MQTPKGRVVSVNGAEPSRTAIVEVMSGIACPRCAKGKGCGAGLLGGAEKVRTVQATLLSGLDVQRGDTVSVAMRPKQMLQAAFVVYGYPLVAALLGALVAWTLQLGDLASAAFALFGIVAGLAVARQRLSGEQCLREFTPTVVENHTAAR